MTIPIVPVFAPNLSLTITLERAGDNGADELHIHPGGQGYWVARMLTHLETAPHLVGPLGGETGSVIKALLESGGYAVSAIEPGPPSEAVIQDRRSGDREMIAEVAGSTSLDRHLLDDLYSTLLDLALSHEMVVVTGLRSDLLPASSYRRLGSDLATAGVTVVGDLHGPELDAMLEGGGMELLKVSDEDLAKDGLLESDDEETAMDALRRLHDRGAGGVVLSRADRPALALLGGHFYRATPPTLDPADFRGAGDSMTAGLTAGLLQDLSPEGLLRLACGAGAANVTRHGLGSGSRELIENLTERVEVEQVGK